MFKEQFVGGTIHTRITGARVRISHVDTETISIDIADQVLTKIDLIELRDLLTKIIDIKYPKGTQK